MAIDNIVTMGWELAHSVCIELEDRHGQGPEPQTYDTVNYFPVEKEPGKFAIGMFTDNFDLLGYIKTDKGA
jgi:hypothetical protein